MKDFKDYYESTKLSNVTAMDIKNHITSLNLSKFSGALSVEEVLCTGIVENELKNIAEWNVRFDCKDDASKSISFKVQFDPDINTIYWNRASTIHEYYISQYICDTITKDFGGEVILNKRDSIEHIDCNFKKEFPTFDKYLDYLLSSGMEFADKAKQYAKSIKREINESLHSELQMAMNNEDAISWPKKKL